MPGFVGTHDHLIASAWTNAGVQIYDARDRADALAKIKAYAEANPDLNVLQGVGWDKNMLSGLPVSTDLDAVISDRPAIILDNTIHDAWLNTAPFVEPYKDSDSRGQFNVAPEVTMAIVTKAADAGLDVFVQTDGDRSSRAAIDAMIAAKAEHPDNRRPLHHAIGVHPEDQERVIEHTIPVNSTPPGNFGWRTRSAAWTSANWPTLSS